MTSQLRSSAHRIVVRALAVAFGVVASTGCARNTVFTTPSTGPTVLSVVYDRFGDIYPGVTISESEFRFKHADEDERLSLRAHYRRMAEKDDPSWRALLTHAGVESQPGAAFPAVWVEVQDSLRARLTTSLQRATLADARSPRTLFVSVHGFNNDMKAASEWYALVHQVVRDHLARSDSAKGTGPRPEPVFLDVYWDGLTASLPPGIWRNAQYNFPLVGLEFRRVLNALDPGIPLRIFTHSSGGPLIASTLGDASDPLEDKDENYHHYFRNAPMDTGRYSPPRARDFRVAMVVPAMAPNTFAKFPERSSRLDRLIIGVNPDDYAISKLMFLCSNLGSTCLSARPQTFCESVRPRFANDPRTKLYVFDFSDSRTNQRKLGFWDEHGVPAYLERDDMKSVLSLLLDDHEVADESAAICGSR